MSNGDLILKIGMSLAVFLLFLRSGAPILQAAAPSLIKLSLAEAIEIAFMNNVDIRVEQENVRRNRLSLLLEESQFDPSLRLDSRADRTVRSSTSGIETGPSGTNRIVQENQRINAGLNQRFRWGGDYDLNIGQFRSKASFQTLNPTISGNLLFSFTQPLLQGFGREITQMPIRIAQVDIAISEVAFQSLVATVLLEVANAYWDLVFQLKNQDVQRQTHQSAERLLASVRAKVESGLLAPIEILVAEAGVASLEESVVIAEKGVQDTEDRLRLLLNLPELSMVAPPSIQPTDRPVQTKKPMDESNLLKWAVDQRPEVKENRLLLQNRSRAIRIAEDRLSPSLDLVGNIGLNGLGGDFTDEIDQLTSGSFHQWEAGLVLSFPLGNREARTNLRIEKTEMKKAELAQEKIVQEITQETKEGVRRVRTDFQRIKTTRRARLLAEEKLNAGNERFHLGLISSQDLLEFQDDLADAKAKELKALTDYNKSLVNLDKVTGTLLNRFRIEISGNGVAMK